MDVQEIKALLQKYRVAALKSRGQHFLINEAAIRQIIHIADIKGYDTILEIGPGLGVLTKRLAAKAKKLIAVEIDKGFVSVLKEELRSFPNIEIVHADILKFSLPPDIDIVVGNLPYYLTGAILEKLLSQRGSCISRIIITVQKEFATRLVASLGNANRIGLFAHYYSAPRIIQEFPPHYFWPQPRVHSTLVSLKVKTPRELPLPVGKEKILWDYVRAAFSQPRKTLRNSLNLDIPGLKERRPEELSLGDWLTIINYQKLGYKNLSALSVRSKNLPSSQNLSRRSARSRK